MKIILASGSPRRKELLEQIGLKFEVIPAKGEEIITKTVPSEIVCELSRQKAEEVAARITLGPDIRNQKAVPAHGAPADKEIQEEESENQKGLSAHGAPADKEIQEEESENQKAVYAHGVPADKEVQEEESENQKAVSVRGDTGKDAGGEGQIIIGADTVVCLDGKVMGKPSGRESAVRMLESLQGRKHSVYTGVTVLVRKPGQEMICHTFFCETKVEIYPMEKRDIEEYADTGDPMDKAGAYGIQGRFAVWVKSIEGDYNNVVGLPVSALWQVLKNYR